jgi:DNA-binding MarR family transcriptional regulator
MPPRRPTQRERQVESVLLASQALVAIVTRSFAEVETSITLPQWRVLVILNGHGSLTPSVIARWMGVHPSNTTRACDVLVRAGLLDRRESVKDRRQNVLTLTPEGQTLVDSLLDFRRDAIAGVLEKLPAAQRKLVSEAMQAFADAAGENPEQFVHGAGLDRLTHRPRVAESGH